MSKLWTAPLDSSERSLDLVFTFGIAPRTGKSVDERLSEKSGAGGFLTFAACVFIFIIAALLPSDAASAVLLLGLVPAALIPYLLFRRRAAAKRRRVLRLSAPGRSDGPDGGNFVRSA